MTRYYYYGWDSVLTHEICQRIINLGKGKWEEGIVIEEDVNLHDTRKSDVAWIDDQWVYDLIWPYMMSANESAGWKYEIAAAERLQLTKYKETGYYTWHEDGIGSHNEVYHDPDNKFRHGNTRKLSMSVILNDDYTAGDLEIFQTKDPLPKFKEGSIVVFPSFLHHRVTPVTEGTRYSLVSWFIGSPFK